MCRAMSAAGLSLRAISCTATAMAGRRSLTTWQRRPPAGVPNHLAGATAGACPELAGAELIVLDYLKSGKIDPKGYGKARQECKERIDVLARKLKSKVVPVG